MRFLSRSTVFIPLALGLVAAIGARQGEVVECDTSGGIVQLENEYFTFGDFASPEEAFEAAEEELETGAEEDDYIAELLADTSCGDCPYPSPACSRREGHENDVELTVVETEPDENGRMRYAVEVCMDNGLAAVTCGPCATGPSGL